MRVGSLGLHALCRGSWDWLLPAALCGACPRSCSGHPRSVASLTSEPRALPAPPEYFAPQGRERWAGRNGLCQIIRQHGCARLVPHCAGAGRGRRASGACARANALHRAIHSATPPQPTTMTLPGDSLDIYIHGLHLCQQHRQRWHGRLGLHRYRPPGHRPHRQQVLRWAPSPRGRLCCSRCGPFARG